MKPQLQIAPNILSISSPFPGILLDAYGVFWGGNGVGMLPGCKNAMETLVSSGKTVGILSNSTQLVAKEKDKLQKQGILEGQHFHFLITSGELAKNIFLEERLPFRTPNKKFWIYGGIHPKFSSPLVLFEGSKFTETHDLTEADFIYISIPHVTGEDQTVITPFLKDIHKLTSTGLPMLCANPDRFAHEGNPPQAVVRQGSIAAIYEEMGGTVYYIGKPASEAFANAMQQFTKYGITLPSDILMVGDTPETDIRGARAFGMHSALVTKTGVMKERISTNALNVAMENIPKEDHPHFYIEQLATNEL